MIQSHSRTAKYAGVVCAVSMLLLLLTIPWQKDVNSFALDIGSKILAIIILISFYVSLWSLLAAKGRSKLWLFTLIFSVVGLIIIFLLKDHTTSTESIASNGSEDEIKVGSSGEALLNRKVVAKSDIDSSVSIADHAKRKLMVTRFLDLICFVVAPAIIVMNWLSINKKYDNSDYILWIGIGVGLIAFGLLRKYWSFQSGRK